MLPVSSISNSSGKGNRAENGKEEGGRKNRRMNRFHYDKSRKKYSASFVPFSKNKETKRKKNNSGEMGNKSRNEIQSSIAEMKTIYPRG